MRQSVRDAFVLFTAPLEGVVPFLYLDVKGLVTIAIGNLVDPIQYARTLPLMRADGMPATPAEIEADWQRVKARQDLRLAGGMAYRNVAQLRLTTEGVQKVVEAKLAQIDQHLTARFPEYPTWPADAQLGLLSMAWAMGPAFRFPLFEAAVKRKDFVVAAHECAIANAEGTVIRRNECNKDLFVNAAIMLEQRIDPSVLYWPHLLTNSKDEPEGRVVDFPIVHASPYQEPDDEPPPNAA